MKALKTNLDRGLTSAEAAELLKSHGPNQLEKEEEESLWDKIKESFEDLLVRILLLAAVISFIIALTGKCLNLVSNGRLTSGMFCRSLFNCDSIITVVIVSEVILGAPVVVRPHLKLILYIENS